MKYPKSVNGINRKEWLLSKAIDPFYSTQVWDYPINLKYMKKFKFRRIQMRCIRKGHDIIGVIVFDGADRIFSSLISYREVKDELTLKHFQSLLGGFNYTFFLNRKDMKKFICARLSITM